MDMALSVRSRLVTTKALRQTLSRREIVRCTMLLRHITHRQLKCHIFMLTTTVDEEQQKYTSSLCYLTSLCNLTSRHMLTMTGLVYTALLKDTIVLIYEGHI